MTEWTVGSLFAGIGGFDLGFERAGMRTIWQVEQDPYRRAVLAKHFPNAERHTDVRDVGSHNLERPTVVCGGFPCQDLSYAGQGAGIDGTRSGLWSEFARIIGELRPRYVVVENVPALLGRGLGRVLGGLASCGYDAEWDCLPASAFGAPHRRDRIWIVAYPTNGRGRDAPDPDHESEPRSAVDESARNRLSQPLRFDEWWSVEPDVGRVANGVSNRVDRLGALGDALAPQIAEWIGRRLVAHG